MKKVDKKGFTLIELLAVIIILGVLLLLAVPSVSKSITKSRMSTYKTNLKQFVSAVTTEVNSMDYSSPYQFSTTQYLVVPFLCIDLESGNNDRSPFGEYDLAKSAIVVVRDTATHGFQYFVSAVDNIGYGVPTIISSDLATTDVIEMVLTGTSPSDTITITRTDTNSETTWSFATTSSQLNSAISGLTGKVYACDAYKTKTAA